jgi:hypothetical protein
VIALLAALAACDRVPPAGTFGDVGARDAARPADAGTDARDALDAASEPDAASAGDGGADAPASDAGSDAGADASSPYAIAPGDLLVGSAMSTATCSDMVLSHVSPTTRTVTRALCGELDTLAFTRGGHVPFATYNFRVECGVGHDGVLAIGSGGGLGFVACTDLRVSQLVPFAGGLLAARVSALPSDCARHAGDVIALLDPVSGAAASAYACAADWWSTASIATEPTGTLLVTATIGGPLGVIDRLVPSTGVTTRVSTYSSDDAPLVIAVGPDGRVFVSAGGSPTDATCFHARLLEIDPTSGAILQTICDARLWTPSAMVVAPDGNTLYVTDSYSGECGSQGALLLVDVSSGRFAISDVVCDADIVRPSLLVIR